MSSYSARLYALVQVDSVRVIDRLPSTIECTVIVEVSIPGIPEYAEELKALHTYYSAQKRLEAIKKCKAELASQLDRFQVELDASHRVLITATPSPLVTATTWEKLGQ